MNFITLKAASHGLWYYNGDEFDGIFKGLFDRNFQIAKNLFDKCNIFVELGTGKMVTSNDPEDSNQFDEVGDRLWVS